MEFRLKMTYNRKFVLKTVCDAVFSVYSAPKPQFGKMQVSQL